MKKKTLKIMIQIEMTEEQASSWASQLDMPSIYEVVESLQQEGYKNFQSFRVLMGESWQEIREGK